MASVDEDALASIMHEANESVRQITNEIFCPAYKKSAPAIHSLFRNSLNIFLHALQEP